MTISAQIKKWSRWQWVIVLLLTLSGCQYELPDECSNVLANEIETLSRYDAEAYIKRVSEEARNVSLIEEMRGLWDGRFSANCLQAKSHASDPQIRLLLAHAIVQAGYNQIVDIEGEEFFSYARTQLESPERGAVIRAISVLFFSDKEEDRELIFAVMQSNARDRLIVDTGIFYLSLQCNSKSEDLVRSFIEQHDYLKTDPRILRLRQSAFEVCETQG